MNWKRIPAAVTWRSLSAILRLVAPYERIKLRDYDFRLPRSNFPHKALTTVRLLERYQPKRIVELGSGESSAWLAAYAAKRVGVRILSINQSNWTYPDELLPDWWNPKWQEASTSVARTFGGVEFIEARAVPEPPNGWRYDLDIPGDTDFVLVDGPYHRTHESGMDVPLMLQRGHRPKVICVDGRTTGVDLIRLLTPDYDFFPQMIWCFEREHLIHSLALSV